MALIYMLMCVLYLYECAKKNSGTVGLTVWNVECAIINVVGPVYQKFKGVPDDFLSFLGTKIDEAADKFDRHAPPLAKQMMYLALVPIQRAFQKTKILVNKAQTGGLRTAIHCAATEYKQILFKQSMTIWVGLEHHCPPVHRVVEKATTAAAYFSQKYNQAVRDLTLKDYTVSAYLPLVPIDEISTALHRIRQSG